MTFTGYLQHYTAMPDMAVFLLLTTGLVLLMHWILYMVARKRSKRYVESDRGLFIRDELLWLGEQYYEMIFSASSILMFTGIYFLITFNYFNLSWSTLEFWNKYRDFLLLLLLLSSMIFTSFLDRIFVPTRHIGDDERAGLRMAALVYMFIIFAYIKFIYEDDNYDTIILYFLVMMAGRFIYFDSSWNDFMQVLRNLGKTLPIMAMALVGTAVVALYGFGTGYLLKSNGVVVSLWISHLYMIVEIIVISWIVRGRLRRVH